MKKSTLEMLKDFGSIAEELRNNPPSLEYWIEEDKLMAKRAKENEKFAKSIQMSYEKYHTPFTI